MKYFPLFISFYLLLSACATRPAAPGASILRIGTTGDYPPLTGYDSTRQQFTGEEIELALQLGRHLGKKVVFVPTTWKTLSADLQSGKFELAVGGITVNPEREKLFIFSVPLSYDRKVALFRCRDSARFRDLTTIDQPGVNIIENIGGTNEKFARKYIRQASLQVIPNNQEIFALLLKGTADVMFTDEIEARYQQQLHPALCRLQLNNNISPAFAKAIMFRKRDSLLLQQVNSWLKHRKSV